MITVSAPPLHVLAADPRCRNSTLRTRTGWCSAFGIGPLPPRTTSPN